MSKRCELQKEYFQQNGNYKGAGKYSDDYVKWLEDKIINEKELLCNFFKFFRDNGEANIGMTIEQFVDEFLKLKN